MSRPVTKPGEVGLATRHHLACPRGAVGAFPSGPSNWVAAWALEPERGSFRSGTTGVASDLGELRTSLLDAFAALYHDLPGDPVAPVFILDGALHQALTSMSGSFPAAELLGTACPGPLSAVADAARQAAAVSPATDLGSFDAVNLAGTGNAPESAVADASRQAATVSPATDLGSFDAVSAGSKAAARRACLGRPVGRLVATDASARRFAGRVQGGREPAIGIAYVSLDGRAIGHDVLLGTSDIEAGELAAARLAAHQVGGKHLTILTDSRAAIAAFHNPTRASSSLAARQAMGLRAEARRRPVELRWVGAHRGHQLNEAADRLAVAARRAYEAGLPAEAAGGLLGGIVADIAAGLLEAGQESVR